MFGAGVGGGLFFEHQYVAFFLGDGIVHHAGGDNDHFTGIEL